MCAQTSAFGQYTTLTWPTGASYKLVHAHLLPSGKVLFWGRTGDNTTQLPVYIWDPTTKAFTSVPQSGQDMFCSGHAFLPDGRLLVAGGHQMSYWGIPYAFIYNPIGNNWAPLPNMNNPRWYPSNTTLPNGDVLVIGGTINGIDNVNPEPQVWQTAGGSWRDLSSAQITKTMKFYPFMFVAPDGRVFMAGPDTATMYLDVNNPQPSRTGVWSGGPSRSIVRNWSTATMYDDFKVLLAGGAPCGFYAKPCSDATLNTAETIDLNSGTQSWTPTGPMKFRRKLHNATVLADGKVLLTGGIQGSEDPNTAPTASSIVSASEIWDPSNRGWTQMASLPTPSPAASPLRAYHSTALLLPDGSVLSGGGQTNTYASAEIYKPPYFFQPPSNPTRPIISSAPLNVTYGTQFFVGTANTGITKATMISLGSVTHGYNMGQRLTTLPTPSSTTGGINLIGPSGANKAPPGYYMLSILDSNKVPSVSKIILLSAATSSPKLSTFNDDFHRAGLDTNKWNSFHSTNYSITQSGGPNGVLQIDNSVATPNGWAGIWSKNLYAVTNSELRGNLKSPGYGSDGTKDVYCWIKLKIDNSNFVEIGVNKGNLYAKQYVSNVETRWTRAYSSSSAMQWLRIRESGGTTYWEYTANNTNDGWTVLASKKPDPIPLTSVLVEIGLGNFSNPSAASGTMQLDNLNTAP